MLRKRPVFGCLVFFALFLSSCSGGPSGIEPRRLSDEDPMCGYSKARFVERGLCVECHSFEYEKWAGSHHDLAMRKATEETVLGDFGNATLEYYDLISRFYKKDGKFFVKTENAEGHLNEYEVKYTFGFYPLQQYLVEFPGGRLQVLTTCWDSRPEEKGGQRWFDLHEGYDERIGTDDPLHWTKPNFNWNAMCAECHSTNIKKNYDPKTDAYNTTWSHINVGCQACHGPGSEHVEWARAIEASGKEADPESDMGLVVKYKNKDSRVLVESCARCHSRRTVISGEYQFGKRFMDHYVPQTLREGIYHADGQILEEDYVYGSFLQSKKFGRGALCTNCHDSHSARLIQEGNLLCLKCHSSAGNPDFPTLKLKDYDAVAHHFHKIGGEGTACVDCHMPATNYMVVDARNDHRFGIPRPDLTVKVGTPNACNACHGDRTPEWASEWIEKWYPETSGERQKAHFAEAIDAGRKHKEDAREKLIILVNDPEEPAIVRASAIELLGGYPSEETLKAVTDALEDEDPLVRWAAVSVFSPLLAPRTADSWMAAYKLKFLAPLLKDPVRAVRIETVCVLAEVPQELIVGEKRRDYERVLAEHNKSGGTDSVE